jgi:hypothetical protein
MNITNTPRHIRLALPFLLGASVLFAACGGDDDLNSQPVDTVEAVVTVDTVADPAGSDVPVTDAGNAAGTQPAQACGLLDSAAVDALLGTSGVTTSVDTSLGLYDGCRWATATTDVPALLLAYDDTMDFEQVRGLACDGTTAEPVAAVGADAVACFGAVVAPAGTGVIMVSIDDPTDQWDDAGEIDLAAQFAADALA